MGSRKSMWAILPFVCSLSVVSCDAQPIQSPAPASPLLLSDPASDRACERNNSVVDKKIISPDNYDEGVFYAARYNKNTSKIKFPLPVVCIYKVYGEDSLREWASRGDLVARYVLFQKRYTKNCADLDKMKIELEAIGGVNFTNKFGAKIARLPESYEVLARIQLTCGFVGESEKSSQKAFDAGFQSELTLGE